MYCTQCGSQLKESSQVCNTCGRHIPQGSEAVSEGTSASPTGPRRVMYCQECETEAEENASYCANCGGTVLIPGTPHIPNHLVWAILSTICCCIPTGIVSIVYAARVNGLVAAGDFARARQASENAKTWAWVSFVLGIPATAILRATLFSSSPAVLP